MQNAGNSFSLPFKDPNWFTTFLVIGLINLIPILGAINTYGWMLVLLDHYRQGRTDLPPAGFQYLGRGMNLFVVLLVYGLVLGAIIGVPFTFILLASLSGAAVNANNGTSFAYPAIFGSSFPLLLLASQVVNIAQYLFTPAVIVATERGGIGGGLNVPRVFSIASASWGNTAIAGLLVFAAYFLGSMGIFACCVGIILTFPYGVAVVAGVTRFYEAGFETPGAIPPPVAGPPTATA